MKRNLNLICVKLLRLAFSCGGKCSLTDALGAVNCLWFAWQGRKTSLCPSPRSCLSSLGSLMSFRLPWAVICSLDKKNAKSEQAESPSGRVSSSYKQPGFELVIMSHGAPSLAQKWLILRKLSVFALLPNTVISHSVFFFLKEQFY